MNSILKYFLGILICSFLTPYVFVTSYSQTLRVNESPQKIQIKERVSSEADAFNSRVIVPFTSRETVGKSRVLSNRKGNRAFDGAPPRIPHPTIENQAKPLGSECTTCHANGGFVEAYQAFTPITPHPNWTNCRQCHVPIQTDGLFHDNNFVGISQIELNARGASAALPGGPPQIPHSLDMRGNCLSCHAGAAAISRIRTEHPERSNCRQCHVPANPASYVWQRNTK